MRNRSEIRPEDPRTGAGNTQLQEEYREEFQRDGMREVHTRRLRRRMLQLAVCPTVEKYRESKDERSTYSLCVLRPFTHHKHADILLFWDRPSARPKQYGKKIETMVTLQQGRLLQGEAKVLVGGGGGGIPQPTVVDFTRAPCQPYQPAIPVIDLANLRADVWSGGSSEVSVRRTGSWIDICRGTLPGTKMPAVMYRINAGYLDTVDPAVIIKNCADMPADGETVALGDVDISAIVATLRKKCEFLRARADSSGHGPAVVRPTDPVLSANRKDLFGLLNRINRDQNDRTFSSGGSLPSPSDWLPDVVVEFPMSTFDNLTKLPGFELQDTMATDMLSALSPGGNLRVLARYSGAVVSVDHLPGEPSFIRVVMDGGEDYVLPACSRLFKQVGETAEPLQRGHVLTEGEQIGTYVPFKIRTVEELRETTGDAFGWLVDVFLRSASAVPGTPGWEGTGAGVSLRYIGANLLQYAARDSSGVVWHWDLRKLFDAGYEQDGFLLPPPMRYDWGTTQIQFESRLELFLGTSRERRGHGDRTTARSQPVGV